MKHLFAFILHTIPNSMIKPRVILVHPAQGMNCPFVQCDTIYTTYPVVTQQPFQPLGLPWCYDSADTQGTLS